MATDGRTVVGICMVKDEADIIKSTVVHMMRQVDHVIVMDNGSTDGTREILAHVGVEEIIDEPDPAYYQSERMTALAHLAAEYGAEWVVPFDADEVWTANDGRTLKSVLSDVPPQWDVVAADLYDHVPTGEDPDLPGDPTLSMRYRRSYPADLPKVAARVRDDLVIEQGNHGAHYGDEPDHLRGLLTVHHFPYRSAEQFVSKVRNGSAAYKATDLPETSGAHWRQYGAILDNEGPEACAGIFWQWFWQPTSDGLVYDPCPSL